MRRVNVFLHLPFGAIVFVGGAMVGGEGDPITVHGTVQAAIDKYRALNPTLKLAAHLVTLDGETALHLDDATNAVCAATAPPDRSEMN